ncbi:MAG: AIM24 family protein, partial [Clostridia bacterium]|nr:AIM24 family protein [Clostridia bacterium]
MLNYKIEGGHLPVVVCYTEANQTLCTERGSMCWMSPNMKMETNAGG